MLTVCTGRSYVGKVQPWHTHWLWWKVCWILSDPLLVHNDCYDHELFRCNLEWFFVGGGEQQRDAESWLWSDGSLCEHYPADGYQQAWWSDRWVVFSLLLTPESLTRRLQYDCDKIRRRWLCQCTRATICVLLSLFAVKWLSQFNCAQIRLTSPLTLHNFIALRQEVSEISAVENLCSSKKWTKIHLNSLRSATYQYLWLCQISSCSAKRWTRKAQQKFFTPFSISAPHGDPLGQSSSVAALMYRKDRTTKVPNVPF